MLECENCNVCCSGVLAGEAHGIEFGNGVPCNFLNGTCTIYEKRPQSCRNYFCAYVQEIIPGLKRPDISGVLFTVRHDDRSKKQYMHALINKAEHDHTQITLAKDWLEQNNSFLVVDDEELPENKDELQTITWILKQKYNNNKLALDVLLQFAQKCETFEEINSVAKTMFQLEFYEEAAKYSEKMLDYDLSEHQISSSLLNAINVLNHANNPKKSLALIERYKSQFGETSKIVLHESYCHHLLNQKEQSFDKLIYALNNFKLTPQQEIGIRYNLASHSIRKGDFKQGLIDFTYYGKMLNTWNVSTIFNGKKLQHIPQWDGKVANNTTIIVTSDAGIGDSIINIRFLKQIEKLGMNAVWLESDERRKGLIEVFNKNGFNSVSKIDINDYEHCYQVTGMRLPVVLGLDRNQLWRGSYLQADKDYVNKWKPIINGNKKLKIGIRWEGFSGYKNNLHRTIPLKQIYQCVKHLDADFYSLQIEEFENQIHDFPEIINLHDQIESWEDTFGLIDNLDFIITSCTSVAHAAGSMGKKVFVFVPIETYYIWLSPEKKSDWYGDNVTVLYQEKNRIWDEPMEQLRLEMKKYE